MDLDTFNKLSAADKLQAARQIRSGKQPQPGTTISASDKLQLARQLQSAHDKEHSVLMANLRKAREEAKESGNFDAVNKAATALYDFNQERKELRQATINLEIQASAESVHLGQRPVPSGDIQSYFIARQKYYIGYGSDVGVVIAYQASSGEEWIPVILLSKKTPLSGNDGRKITDARTPVSRNLTEADFRMLIAARPFPSADELQAAYTPQVKQAVSDNLIERMGLNNATVLF